MLGWPQAGRTAVNMGGHGTLDGFRGGPASLLLGAEEGWVPAANRGACRWTGRCRPAAAAGSHLGRHRASWALPPPVDRCEHRADHRRCERFPRCAQRWAAPAGRVSAWRWGASDDGPFYYRVQSPVVLIEFDHHPGVAFDNVVPWFETRRRTAATTIGQSAVRLRLAPSPEWRNVTNRVCAQNLKLRRIWFACSFADSVPARLPDCLLCAVLTWAEAWSRDSRVNGGSSCRWADGRDCGPDSCAPRT